MAVLDNPTVWQAIAYVIAKKAEKAKPKAKNRTRTRMQAISNLLLHLAGFGCLTYAGFSWNITAGYVIAGLSCFALSTLNSKTDRPDGSETTDPMLRR